MSSIGSVPSVLAGFPGNQVDKLPPVPKLTVPADAGSLATPGTQGFGQMLDGLVGMVDAKDVAAQNVTRQVLLGDSDQLHQSVIAMQEASVAFSLMIEVRNKLVESYQELMRMQV
jgi:flagellar hook-basal body complex protein FliE